MKLKQIIPALLVASLTTGAMAQNIQREVDVTRAYEPSVQNFLKLGISPDMADTAQMRPDFQYEITPRPLRYGFSVNPINPAQFATVGGRTFYPGYAKVGLGFPMQSVADLRYVGRNTDPTKWGFFANHYGQYGKIENDLDIKESAFQTFNRGGFFVDHRLSGDLFVGGNIDYDFNKVTRYGYYSATGILPGTFDTSKDALGQFYHDLRGQVHIGNSFTDSGKFNFDVNLGGGYFGDRYKYDQWDVLGGFKLAFPVGYSSGLEIRGELSTTGGMKNLDGYSNTVGTAGLLFRYDDGALHINLGGDFGYDKVKSDDQAESKGKATFLPEVLLEYVVADGVVIPFIEWKSRIERNSFADLARINPYVYSGISMPNTKSHQGQAGIKGTIGGSFKYRLYCGYSILKDAYYWQNAYFDGSQGNAFFAMSDDELKVIQGGLEVEANIVNALAISGAFKYSDYSSDGYEYAGGLPELEGRLGLTYNYRNRLYLSAGATFLGERHMYEYYVTGNRLTVNTLSSAVDLGLGVDYFIKKELGVFLRVNNLLNQELYQFNRYKMLGINAQAGVMISF